jgi:hypothetical protein
MSETSMVSPWEVLSETRERPPPMSETSMAAPLRGAVGDPGAPTTYVGDVDGGPPKRRCWLQNTDTSVSARIHIQCVSSTDTYWILCQNVSM